MKKSARSLLPDGWTLHREDGTEARGQPPPRFLPLVWTELHAALHDERLTSEDLLVLLATINFRGPDGLRAPTAWLARLARLTPEDTYAHFMRLGDLGYLSPDRSREGGPERE